MPRIAAALSVVAIASFCIVFNVVRYPAVWKLVPNRSPQTHDFVESKPPAPEHQDLENAESYDYYSSTTRSTKSAPVVASISSSSDYGDSDYGDSDYGDSDYGDSDYGDSDYGDSDYGDSDYGDSDYGDSDYGDSDYGDSDYGDSDYGDSDYGDSDYGDSDYGDSDYGDSDYGDSDYEDSVYEDSGTDSAVAHTNSGYHCDGPSCNYSYHSQSDDTGFDSALDDSIDRSHTRTKSKDKSDQTVGSTGKDKKPKGRNAEARSKSARKTKSTDETRETYRRNTNVNASNDDGDAYDFDLPGENVEENDADHLVPLNWLGKSTDASGSDFSSRQKQQSGISNMHGRLQRLPSVEQWEPNPRADSSQSRAPIGSYPSTKT